jgi:hypothetical protein
VAAVEPAREEEREQKLIELMDIDGFAEVKRNQEQHC